MHPFRICLTCVARWGHFNKAYYMQLHDETRTRPDWLSYKLTKLPELGTVPPGLIQPDLTWRDSSTLILPALPWPDLSKSELINTNLHELVRLSHVGLDLAKTDLNLTWPDLTQPNLTWPSPSAPFWRRLCFRCRQSGPCGAFWPLVCCWLLPGPALPASPSRKVGPSAI